jgi:hypothetical protein
VSETIQSETLKNKREVPEMLQQVAEMLESQFSVKTGKDVNLSNRSIFYLGRRRGYMIWRKKHSFRTALNCLSFMERKAESSQTSTQFLVFRLLLLKN